MFDNPISSISCGGLDFVDSAVDFEDLAFLNLIMCLQEADSALAAKMSEIRNLNEKKRELVQQIDILNSTLAKSPGAKDEDKVFVPGSLEDPNERASLSNIKSVEDFLTAVRLRDPALDEKLRALYEKEGMPEKVSDVLKSLKGHPDLQTGVWKAFYGDEKMSQPIQMLQVGRPGHFYKRSEVKAQIEKLRNGLEELNTASSVLMIDLQRLMNKRNEAVTLTSNIEAQSHQTAMGIISNFK